MSIICCDIVSVEQEIFCGEVILVVVIGELGELGIVFKYVLLIMCFKLGKVVVIMLSGEQLDFVIFGGIFEVQLQVVIVLVDIVICVQDIDEVLVCKVKEEVECILVNCGEVMEVVEVQQCLVEVIVQLQVFECLCKNLKY